MSCGRIWSRRKIRLRVDQARQQRRLCAVASTRTLVLLGTSATTDTTTLADRMASRSAGGASGQVSRSSQNGKSLSSKAIASADSTLGSIGASPMTIKSRSDQGFRPRPWAREPNARTSWSGRYRARIAWTIARCAGLSRNSETGLLRSKARCNAARARSKALRPRGCWLNSPPSELGATAQAASNSLNRGSATPRGR